MGLTINAHYLPRIVVFGDFHIGEGQNHAAEALIVPGKVYRTAEWIDEIVSSGFAAAVTARAESSSVPHQLIVKHRLDAS